MCRSEKTPFAKRIYTKIECTIPFLFLEEYKLIRLVGRLYLSKSSGIRG
jgi:hypothetical protein